ncbi:hypothetical protein NKG94_45385 [Micromonospora sp. M12]
MAVNDSAQGATDALSTVGITVRPDGWIEYASVLRSVGVSGTSSRVAGVREKNGGCTLAGSDKASSGSSRTTYTEEVAYNPATCEFDILVADLTPAQAANINSLGGAKAIDASSARNAGNMAPAATYSRYLKTSWIDPINITISSQKWGSSGRTRPGSTGPTNATPSGLHRQRLPRRDLHRLRIRQPVHVVQWLDQDRQCPLQEHVVRVVGRGDSRRIGLGGLRVPQQLSGRFLPHGQRNGVHKWGLSVELERLEERRVHEPRPSW